MLGYHGAVLVDPHEVEGLAPVVEPDGHLLRRGGSRSGKGVAAAHARAVIVPNKVVAVGGENKLDWISKCVMVIRKDYTVRPICSKAEIRCVYFQSLLPAGRLVLVFILP